MPKDYSPGRPSFFDPTGCRLPGLALCAGCFAGARNSRRRTRRETATPARHPANGPGPSRPLNSCHDELPQQSVALSRCRAVRTSAW